MGESIKLLCVDDERNVLRALERIFMDDDYEILTAGSGDEGLALFAENPDIQVVLSDYRMPGMNGVEFLRQVCEKYPDTVRIVLSGYADTSAVVAAINEGQIYKFVSKPWSDEELRQTVAKAVESFALHRQNEVLVKELAALRQELAELKQRLAVSG
jgi:two-component system NtrC family sensor kinase